jgi:hypothetical protein
MAELTLPANVSDLTQEQYDLYVTEVKAMLFQMPNLQSLVTPDSLLAVINYEIVSIPQTNGGICIPLRSVPSPLDTAISAFNALTEQEQAQFFAAVDDD